MKMKSETGLLLFLVLVFGSLYFTFLGQSAVIDYDEGIYAEVSRQMFQQNELLIPTHNGQDFFEKPPMLYWSQILGYRIFGVSSLGARFFNAVAAATALLVFYFCTRIPLGSRQSFKATLIFGSSLLTLYLGRVAMTDMILTLFLLLSLITSWYGVEKEMKQPGTGRYLFWLGCLFAALAMLTKGIVGAFFPVVTAVIYLISIRRLSLLFRLNWIVPGTLIMVVVGFSWYIMLGICHPDGFGFMKELFMEHHMGRFSNAMEGHSGPFFYYVLVLLAGMLPWFGYVFPAFFRLPMLRSDTQGGRYLRLFFIFSMLVFLFFSVAATKLPNYILPAVPGFALFISLVFRGETGKANFAFRGIGLLSGILLLLLGVGLMILPLAFPYLGGWLGDDALKVPLLAEQVELGYGPFFAGLMFLAAGSVVSFTATEQSRMKLFGGLLSGALLLNFALVLFVQPLYDRLADRPLVHMAQQAASYIPKKGRIVLYKIDLRPSVNFYSDRNTIYVGSRDVQTIPALFGNPGEPAVGITTSYYFAKLDELGMKPEKLDSDTGFILFTLGRQGE